MSVGKSDPGPTYRVAQAWPPFEGAFYRAATTKDNPPYPGRNYDWHCDHPWLERRFKLPASIHRLNAPWRDCFAKLRIDPEPAKMIEDQQN